MSFTLGFVFAIGYALGRIDTIVSMLKKKESDSFVAGVNREQKKSFTRRAVDIDESKFVTDVSTTSLKSGGASLGTVTQTKDDISSATNKLAQLKKAKG